MAVFALFLSIFICYFAASHAFTRTKVSFQPRLKPVHENFGLDIAADPSEVTPRALLGEVAYKTFVEKNNPDGLIVKKYDIITRTRELKLLTLLADSGLIEALEAKGLTLSTIEKLLPLADQLNLLPLLVKNKDLVLALAPLIIEPAPLLLPIATKLVRTSPSTFLFPGLALEGFGLFETIEGNALLGILAILTGLPAVAIGAVLNLLNFESLASSAPSPAAVLASATIDRSSSNSSNRPIAQKKKTASTPTPTTPVVKVAASNVSGTTRRRAVVKVN
jgi:hypothetical protein